MAAFRLSADRRKAATPAISRKKSALASLLVPAGARRTADGCTVAKTGPAHSDWTTSPRCWVTRKSFPSSDWAAVLPRATTRARLDQADLLAEPRLARAHIELAVGFLCSLRLVSSFRTNLKCLTALVR